MEIVRVLAPNPGPYTGTGTNTYVIHDGRHAVVLDPGPVIESHRLAIESSLRDLNPVGVVVTHNHSDHAPLANIVAEGLGVAAYGFAAGPDFTPDIRLGDGDHIEIGSEKLVAVHTPGHTWDHLCFLAGRELFTGDHIMGGSTVIIEDAATYFESLHRVAGLGARAISPGHGEHIDDAAAAIAAYIEHRRQRERQIVAAVGNGAATVREIVEAVYDDIDPVLIPAASVQVRVQLKKLISEKRLFLDPVAATEMRVSPPHGEN